MERITQLKTLYSAYEEKALAVRKAARAFDGFLGMGKDPRNDACHTAFYDAVGAWTEQFVASQPEQELLLQAVMFMTEEPANHKNEDCYWFMYVCHGHMRLMIPLLEPESCRRLAARYDALYKKLDRLPVHKDVYKMLTKAGK